MMPDPRRSPGHLGIVRSLTSSGVAAYIETLIFDGRLKAGERIDRDQIAAELHVSRAPVQEALVRLQRDGLVEIRYHRGAFVAPLDLDMVREHFETYGLLIGLASQKAARRRNPSVVDKLEAILAEVHRCRPDDIERQWALHWDFRSVINHEGAGLRLLALLRSTTSFMPISTRLAAHRSSDVVVRSMEAELRAFRAGDADAAREAATAMIDAVGEMVIAELIARGVLVLAEPTE